MTKVITLYNHKGGVSKTTSSFNLAHFLANQGKKVLAVDADPQCNLTELMLAPLIYSLDEEENRTGTHTDIPGSSLLDLLLPRIEGTTPIIDTEAASLIFVKDNLYILKGDVGLSNIEDSLSEAHSQRFSSKTHEKRTYVAISDFFSRIGSKENFDFIIVDVGPSSGALTRTCFLASDGFFIPTSPDRFNVQAMGSLSQILGRWLREHSQIIPDFKELSLPVKENLPQFLGVILQNFKIRGGKPKATYQMWMDRIPAVLNEKLIPVLRESSSTQDLTSGLSGKNVVVSEIRDYEGLAPLMQEHGKPMFGISKEDTKILHPQGHAWSGQVWSDAEARMAEYKNCISEISARLDLLV